MGSVVSFVSKYLFLAPYDKKSSLLICILITGLGGLIN